MGRGTRDTVIVHVYLCVCMSVRSSFERGLFVSYGVIYLLCLPLLAIWTSPKLNVSMVNWLADCRFDLDYRIAWRVLIKFSKNQKICYKRGCPIKAVLGCIAWLCLVQLLHCGSILLASVIFASLYRIVLYQSVTIII